MSKKKEVLKKINLDNYIITGHYYTIGQYRFRKYLNIKSKGFKGHVPDLMVIMMNPGSSTPINGNDNEKVETPAKPDLTQNQIIRIMEKSGFKYARILNLSDLREPKSEAFYKKIELMDLDGINHSIFEVNRMNDFYDLYIEGIPVIYAWGVNAKLSKLAKNAIKLTQFKNHIGWKKPKYDFAYYHPLPRSYHKQKEWLEIINKKIKQIEC